MPRTAPPSTALRPMRADDAEVVADLTSQLGYPVAATELASRAAEIRARTDEEIIVATDESDRPIGWIHVGRLAILEASATAIIHGLVVDGAHRSSGTGAALVDAAEAWAREHGATAMVVYSRSTRERAHRFYERVGYVEIKRSHVFSRSLV
jgi:GNAT superfamily N-acetyltransferase